MSKDNQHWFNLVNAMSVVMGKCMKSNIMDKEDGIFHNLRLRSSGKQSTMLRLSSYNIGGIISNIKYLEDYLKYSDTCAIQEHWLYPDSLNFLSSVHKDFVCWGKSSYDLDPYSIWGRGKGGVALLWKKNLHATIDKLDNIGNDRIILIKLRFRDQSNFFIINAYLPASNLSFSSYQSYINELDDIVNRLCSSGMIVILGDINGHVGNHLGPRSFNRINQRGLVLACLMEEMNFVSINSQMTCTGPIETFYRGNGLTASAIDHIMIRKDNLHFVEQSCVEEDHSDNISYHLPIFCTICILLELKKTTIKPKPCHSWKTIQN